MKTQAVGEFLIDRVVESEGPFGTVEFLLPEATQELIDGNAGWLKPRFVAPVDNQLVLSFHSYVLRTRRCTILVDTCTGNDKERPARAAWHRQNNDYLDRLARAGVQPGQVDFIFCTHMHADHVGWNTRLENGRWVPTFPKARYVFARREYEYWEREHREALRRGLEPPNHGSFGDSVLPVVDAGRAVFVDSDYEIDAGLHLEPAAGHSPGSCLLHARSGPDHALFTGDVMHSAVQLARPALSSRFCFDPAASARVRTALCERYADTSTRIFTGHFPTPVAGRIIRHGDAFRFQFSDQ